MKRPCPGSTKGTLLQEDQQVFLELNAELAEEWPNLTEKKDAPADAEEWNGVPNKLEMLER